MKKIYTLFTFFICSQMIVSAQNTISVCGGEQVCLVGGSYTGTIQWQSSTDLVSWTNIPSATTDTFCFTFSSTGYYRAEITSGTCDPVYSDTTLINQLVAAHGTDTFFYTGSLQQFVITGCIDSVTITCYGAQGGAVTNQPPYPQGGLGAIMQGKFGVTAGDTLNVIVGARGNSDPSSSGGGGASGVGEGTTPWIIAGGGGGADFQDPSYPGMDAVTTNNGVDGGNYFGSGGTTGADGLDNAYTPTNISRGGRGWNSGNTGSVGQDGLSSNATFTLGTFGIGGGGGSVGYGWCNCGGGGGGYSGGGSGDINNSGGGGGSYNVGVNQNNVGGANSGNGMVIISW